MTNYIEKILLQMYCTDTIDKIPHKVITAISDAHKLCELTGGELRSRQIIANIIIQNDEWKCYSPESDDYIGKKG